MKDSSLVRAAEAVRDGKASAMVSAGNTGATMASALLRMGRIKGVARPAIATPIPCPGADTPTVLLDAGANAECQPDWLVQFAQMGAVFARERYGIASPEVGLLSIGEEPGKGDTPAQGDLRPARGAGLGRLASTFVGNVEGRDLMSPEVDVVVTDGFTGNVALKTLEGGMRALVGALASRLRHRRRQPGRRRRADAGAPAALRPARPGHHRGRHAPRRRRRVHHQPRLVVGHGHGQRHPGRPRTWSPATWWATWPRAVARDR